MKLWCYFEEGGGFELKDFIFVFWVFCFLCVFAGEGFEMIAGDFCQMCNLV